MIEMGFASTAIRKAAVLAEVGEALGWQPVEDGVVVFGTRVDRVIPWVEIAEASRMTWAEVKRAVRERPRG